MRSAYQYLSLIFCIFVYSHTGFADGHGQHAWSLVGDQSKVSYGSIKKNSVGEVNHFKSLKGAISANGEVKVTIDLSSIETFIDIRNKRMIEHVFGGPNTQATLTATIDMNTLKSLKVGQTTSVDVAGKLSYLGSTVDIDTTIIAAKLTKSRILAVTDEMIMVKTADLGAEAGIDKLMELAKLPGITRVAPVTFRFVFDQSHKAASAKTKAPAVKKPAVAAASAGNPVTGKKLYRQCLGCHQDKKANNGVGPHLVGVIGRKAGSVQGFSYSGATKKSNIEWNEENLKAFLANPGAVIPGNSMPFPGVANKADLEHLIAYMKTF